MVSASPASAPAAPVVGAASPSPSKKAKGVQVDARGVDAGFPVMAVAACPAPQSTMLRACACACTFLSLGRSAKVDACTQGGARKSRGCSWRVAAAVRAAQASPMASYVARARTAAHGHRLTCVALLPAQVVLGFTPTTTQARYWFTHETGVAPVQCLAAHPTVRACAHPNSHADTDTETDTHRHTTTETCTGHPSTRTMHTYPHPPTHPLPLSLFPLVQSRER
jgi:hypothetical protein